MPSEPAAALEQPIGSLEYELTDELAIQAATILFEDQSRQVKEDIVRRGAPHAALPIVIASATLLIAIVAALIWALDSMLTLPLIVLAVLVELLLLWKAALYFCPPFARWYLRRQAPRMARRLPSRTIRWTFFEDRLETKSAAIERTLPWSELVKVDVLAELWCLSFRSRRRLFVPAGVLAPELQALIRRKATDVGIVMSAG